MTSETETTAQEIVAYLVDDDGAWVCVPCVTAGKHEPAEDDPPPYPVTRAEIERVDLDGSLGCAICNGNIWPIMDPVEWELLMLMEGSMMNAPAGESAVTGERPGKAEERGDSP